MSESLVHRPAAGAQRRWLLISATLLVAAEFVWLVQYSWGIAALGGEAWQTGDWLINYAGGPVRRGLVGEVVFAMSGVADPIVVVFMAQFALLFVFVAASLWLLWLSPGTPVWVMVTISPAFLLFPFLSPEGGLRKELFALSAAALLALALRLKWPVYAWIPSLALFLVGSFAHESVALTLPIFTALLVIGWRSGVWSRGAALGGSGAFTIIATSALVFALLRPGSTEQVAAICDSWSTAGYWGEPANLAKFCSGAVSALDDGLLTALRQTVGMFPSYFNLILPVALALVPLALLRLPQALAWTAVAVVVSLLPLFVVGIDYGRWIFLAITLVSLGCLGASRSLGLRGTDVPPWLVMTYVAVWSLPYTGSVISNSLLVQVLSPGYQAVAERLASAVGLS